VRAADLERRRPVAERIRDVVARQEELGLDVLVHGEPERTDMVEHFAEQLEGSALTEHGWVQSYGSRCVKPPVLFSDVDRPAPMTVRWWRVAQEATARPLKGMLTGPVTLLGWSFVRDDQPREATARQLALAVRDEAADLEAAGAAVIQVDEAALREGLPPALAAHPGALGPGVYDIHAPRVPCVEEVEALLARAEQVVPRERLWVNPDCGLKTRRWEEVVPAPAHLVEAARRRRAAAPAGTAAGR